MRSIILLHPIDPLVSIAGVRVIDYRPYLEDQIEIQLDAIASWKRWSAIVFGGGVLIILTGYLVSIAGVAGTEMMKWAGAFISAVATVPPFREIPPRRARISTYRTLLIAWKRAVTEADRKDVEELIRHAMKETLKP